MKLSISKTVGEFRRDMAAQHSTFFVVYTDVDKATGEILTKVTSNSTPPGITAIFSLLLRPTDEAVTTMVKALPRPSWFASKKKREAQARKLLDQLRRMFTTVDMDAKPVAAKPERRVLV